MVGWLQFYLHLTEHRILCEIYALRNVNKIPEGSETILYSLKARNEVSDDQLTLEFRRLSLGPYCGRCFHRKR